MKKIKKIIITLLIVLNLVLLSGCNETKKEETKKAETKQTETTKEQTKEEEKEEETPKIDETKYEKYNVENLSYSVLKTWEHISKDDYEYHYPVKDKRDAFLMVTTSNVGEKNITESFFKTFMDSYVSELESTDSMDNARVNNEYEIIKKDDFWISDVDFKGDMQGKYYHFITRLMYDNKTGLVYIFSFIQLESISDENLKEFQTVLSTITLR